MTNMSEPTRKKLNIYILGSAFFMIFTAFNTMGNIQTVILANAKDTQSAGYVPNFSGDGFYSLAIIYAFSAILNRLATPIVTFIGLKWTMVIGSMTYVLFISSFYVLTDKVLYLSSFFVGLGAAILWPAQGAFLTMNSEPKDLARNSGLFIAMFLSSYIAGNTIAFFQFQDVEDIDQDLRNFFVTILVVCGTMGTLFLMMLMPVKEEKCSHTSKPTLGPWESLKLSFSLFGQRDMQLLTLFFLYMGMELTFTTGVYGACLGFTRAFEGSKGMSALHGIGNGLGGLTSGVLLIFVGNHTHRVGRYPIVMLGFACHILAYILILLNIPNSATLGNTNDLALIYPSNKVLAIVSSFLLGFGDSSFNSQTLSLLGLLYRDQATPAFALFKLIQSSSAALAFFYAGHLPLYYHLALLLGFGMIGTLSYIKVDLKALVTTSEHLERVKSCKIDCDDLGEEQILH